MAPLSSHAAVEECLRTLSRVVQLDVLEIWTHSREGFVLIQTYVSPDNLSEKHRAILQRYHAGEEDNVTSRHICKRALQSKHGFYWLAKQNRSLSVQVDLHTAISFHIPRDNINSDVFLVGFAKDYMKYSQSKLDFLCWMSQATCLAVFSAALLSTTEDEDTASLAYEASMTDTGGTGVVKPTSTKRSSLAAIFEDGAGNGAGTPSPLPFIPDDDVEVSEHQASRQIDLKSVHVRRRSLCVQDAIKDVPFPQPVSFASSTTRPFLTSSLESNDLSAVTPPDVEEAVRKTMATLNMSPTSARAHVTSPGNIDSSDSTGDGAAVSPLMRQQSSGKSDVTEASRERTFPPPPPTERHPYYRTSSPAIRTHDESPDIDVDDSSTVLMKPHLVQTFNAKQHPVDVRDLEESVREGSQHSRGTFSFKISNLEIRRDINRQVDLQEFTNMAFLTEGSNSHIFSATWQNQPVIIKMLQADKVNSTIAVHEFEVECELLTRIDHPNIVQVMGAGTHPRPFIVLERLRDLSEILDLNSAEESRPSIFHRRKFTYVEVLQIAYELAQAINYIHNDINGRAMIIHRDLKPENLGLAANGTLKLFDFGLCRCVKKRSMSNATYEMTGNTGSLRYMAPEVVLDLPYNETVDAFSFGIVVWTIACNKLPFRGFDRSKHHSAVVLGGGRPKLEAGWPPAFAALLSQCWHQDSAQRPTFDDVARRLGEMLESEKLAPGSKSSNSVLRRVSVSMFGLGKR